MVTTIQRSNELKERLSLRKTSEKDSYEEVIWNLLEDTLELNEQTKKDIAEARKEYEHLLAYRKDKDASKLISHEDLKRELGL